MDFTELDSNISKIYPYTTKTPNSHEIQNQKIKDGYITFILFLPSSFPFFTSCLPRLMYSAFLHLPNHDGLTYQEPCAQMYLYFSDCCSQTWSQTRRKITHVDLEDVCWSIRRETRVEKK